MRVVEFKTSDGRIIKIQGPDDASDEQFAQEAARYDERHRRDLSTGRKEATPYRESPEEPPSVLETAGRQALQGATLGTADEIQAGLAGLVGEGYRLFSDNYVPPSDELYRQAMQQSERRMAADFEHNPGTTIGTNLAGGLLSGAGVARGVGSLIKTPWISNTATGAAIGGLAGAGTAGEGDRPIGALFGGVTGGALGAGGHFAAEGASKAISKWIGAPTSSKAGNKIQEMARASGTGSVDDVVAKLDDLGPEAVPADVMTGNQVMLKAGGEFLDPQDLQPLVERAERGYGRLMQTIKPDWGDDVATFTTRKDMAKTRADRASPLYDKAYEETGAQLSGSLRAKLGYNAQGEIVGKSPAAKLARRLRKEYGGDPALFSGKNITLKGAQQITEDMSKEAKRLGGSAKTRMLQAREAIIKDMEKVSPDWGSAKAIWAKTKHADDLIEDGSKFMKLSAPELRDRVSRMSETDLDYFMMGVGEELQKRLQSAANINKPLTKESIRAKLSAIDKPSAERLMKALEREEIFTDTATQAKRAQEAAMGRIEGGAPNTFQTSLATPVGIMARLGSEASVAAREKLSEKVRSEVARAMLDKEKYLKMMTTPPNYRSSVGGIPNTEGLLSGLAAQTYVREQ